MQSNIHQISNLKSITSRLILSCFLLLASCFSLFSQQPKPLTRIEFVFDASFSMFGQWQSGMKMDIAKKMLTEFLDSIKNVDNLEIAFRAYGHQYGLGQKEIARIPSWKFLLEEAIQMR